MHKIRLGFATLTSFLAITFLMQTIAQVTVVDANPFTSLSLSIKSPENRVYNTTAISVIFNVDTPIQHQKIVKMSYSLDGSSNRTLVISSSQTSRFGTPIVSYVGTTILVNLSNCTHTLDVYALDARGTTFTYPTGRTFVVNATSIDESEQPLLLNNNIAIVTVIAIIAVTIDTVISVLFTKNKKAKVSN